MQTLPHHLLFNWCHNILTLDQIHRSPVRRFLVKKPYDPRSHHLDFDDLTVSQYVLVEVLFPRHEVDRFTVYESTLIWNFHFYNLHNLLQ